VFIFLDHFGFPNPVRIYISDPDPHGSALVFIGWIRIQKSKNDPLKKKTVKKFHVLLKCWMFFLRDGGFSCSLNVLHSAVKFYNVWSSNP
jgi:hypothetical protein